MADAQMPERIWIDNIGIPDSDKYAGTYYLSDDDDHETTEYLRSDLCASGQVRALELRLRDWQGRAEMAGRALEAVLSGKPVRNADEIVSFCKTAALTPAPQAEQQVQRLSEAIRQACYLLAERSYGSPARSPAHNARLVLEAALAPATPTAQEEDPMMTDEEISKFIADYGHPEDTFRYLTPPQPSDTVAEATKHALDACRIIDAAVLEGHDNTSDLICHLLEAVEPARAALRALKGEDK